MEESAATAQAASISIETLIGVVSRARGDEEHVLMCGGKKQPSRPLVCHSVMKARSQGGLKVSTWRINNSKQ